jgi:hypothetical protein
VAQVVKYLPSRSEALDSNPRSAKEKEVRSAKEKEIRPYICSWQEEIKGC